MFRWLSRHGLNTFVYAPKDDPYQRERWRSLYPDHGVFLSYMTGARQSRLRFVYSISPGLDMCYSAASDREALLRKLDQLRSSGITAFMLAFDDIPRSFHCQEDKGRYGEGDAALGRAHAEVATAVFRWNPRGKLIVVPSDYAEVERTPYLAGLTASLAKGIDIAWTGPYVVPSRISVAHADAIAGVYGRLPVLWDNYPVNDFARDDLHLGPVAGRAPGLPGRLAGFLSNPMNEAWASRIPLFTVAAYLRNPTAYRPDTAWRAAVRELGGRRGAQTLMRLADNSQSSSTLDDPRAAWSRESTVLWPRVLLAARSLRGSRWSAHVAGADRRLQAEWRTLVDLPTVMPPLIAAELDPWTRALAANDDLGRAALAYVAATRPRFRSLRVRRSGGHWKVSGRVLVPARAELDRLSRDVDVTAARRTPHAEGDATAARLASCTGSPWREEPARRPRFA